MGRSWEKEGKRYEAYSIECTDGVWANRSGVQLCSDGELSRLRSSRAPRLPPFSLHTLIPPSPRSSSLFSLYHHPVPRNDARCILDDREDASRSVSYRLRRGPQCPPRSRNWLRSEYRSRLLHLQERVPTSHRASSHSGSTRRTLHGSPSSRSTTPSSTPIRLPTS